MTEEMVITEEELPKANLSPTANPYVYLDKDTGELYYLYTSPTDFQQEPRLIKLNQTKDRA